MAHVIVIIIQPKLSPLTRPLRSAANVARVLPPVHAVPQRRAHLRVEKAVQQRHGESLLRMRNIRLIKFTQQSAVTSKYYCGNKICTLSSSLHALLERRHIFCGACTHLRAEQHRTRHCEYVAADALIRSGQHDQISDAQQRQQHEQRFGRFAVLSRLDRVGGAQFGDEDLCVCVCVTAATTTTTRTTLCFIFRRAGGILMQGKYCITSREH